jgi:hypothetical protein
MGIYHLFATLLGPLVLNEMLVVKLIISDGWTRVFESALLNLWRCAHFERNSLDVYLIYSSFAPS